MHDGAFHHHHHDEEPAHVQSMSEAEAMLGYMLDHNRSHIKELHELAHGLSGEASELLHESVHYFEHGVEKLEEALGALKGEK